jgi:HK97 gp10 family phage protein
MPQFEIKIEGLTELKSAFKVVPEVAIPELKKAIQTSVNLIRPIMVKNAPYRKGKLRQNIYARTSGLKGMVGPDLNATKYALYVHEGTKPYVIYPRTKKFLAFKIGSKWVFTKKVNHPGIKSNPFVKNTVVEIEPYVKQIFSNSLQNIKNLMLKLK